MTYFALVLALASLAVVLTGVFGNVRRRTQRALFLIAVLDIVFVIVLVALTSNSEDRRSTIPCGFDVRRC